MLYIVSDIHMNDTGSSGCVTDEELVAFVSSVGESCKKGKVTLVLLGDILDLLRSPEWEQLWDKEKSAPWSNMGPKFTNFSEGFSEECALRIARAIRSRYPKFEERLRELVASAELTVDYVPGNHDYMVQLSPKLREVLTGFFSIKHDPEREFRTTYQDRESGVYAVHGNSFDPLNFHRREDGYWALGDAVVLRIVNRFARMSCAAIGATPRTEVGKWLHDLDNVEPLSDVAIYIAWIAETFLKSEEEKKQIRAAWRDVVEDFLAIPHFKAEKGYRAMAYRSLREVFRLSTKYELSRLLAEVATLVPERAGLFHRAADELANVGQRRFVVFGHTHDPTLTPLPSGRGPARFYVNTGCWRRIVARPFGGLGASFARRRLSCHFRVDGSVDASPYGRYHLSQEWHAS